MSLQRRMNRHGIDYETAVANNTGGSTITRQKPVRPGNSYRGARRNTYFEMAKEHFKQTGTKPVDFRTFCHTIWSKGEWSIAPLINMSRISFVSKKPSKYTPHDGGRKFIPTIKGVPSAAHIIKKYAGMAYHQMLHVMRSKPKGLNT